MLIANIEDAEVSGDTGALVVQGKGKVFRKRLVAPQEESGPAVLQVSCQPWARLRFHTHAGEQILIVTEGKGIPATETQEHVVTPGTVSYIPPAAVHWHGATEKTSFPHVAVVRVGSKPA